MKRERRGFANMEITLKTRETRERMWGENARALAGNKKETKYAGGEHSCFPYPDRDREIGYCADLR